MLVGFDIGGTKCAVSVGYEKDGELVIVDKSVIQTGKGIAPEVIIGQMMEMAEKLTDNIESIGISCGGPLDPVKGIIMSPPNLPGWDDVHIVEELCKKYGCPVKLCNDADACAYAEWRFGAGKGTQNMIFFTFGTGLGAGLILGGKIYAGSNYLAGEAGHIRLAPDGPVGYGKAGSFEGFCSGGGIAQLGKFYAKDALANGKECSFCKNEDELETITAATIGKKADEGYEDAKGIYALCGEKLGEGLSIVIDILDPDMIVIGSIFARSTEHLVPSMEKSLRRECLKYGERKVSIVPAKLGEKLGDYAALSLSAMALEENK